MLRTIFTQSFYYANEKDIKYIGAHINLYMKSLNKNKLVTCSFVDYLADFTAVHFFSKNRIIFDREDRLLRRLDWDYDHTDFYQRFGQNIKLNDLLIFPSYMGYSIEKETGNYRIYNVLIQNG